MEIRPVGAEMLHADEQTDMTKPVIAFRNSANAPKEACTLSVLACFFMILRKMATLP